MATDCTHTSFHPRYLIASAYEPSKHWPSHRQTETDIHIKNQSPFSLLLLVTHNAHALC